MLSLWRSVGAVGRINPKLIRQCTTSVPKKEVLFFQDEVQNILKSLTGCNTEKVFRPRKEGKETKRSVYQFVTAEELEQLQKEYVKKAEMKLQMPPVLDQRKERGRILEEDPLLAGFDNSKIIFTDITYGVVDRERLIVVRDIDGTLRTADWEEQDRINLTYFPRDECKHYVPALFEPENLENILTPEKYEYILDRNFGQFEPDHPIYIRTAEIVYNHVNENKNFKALESTRHFGPMVFYLCWNRQIDNLLVHQILSKNLMNAALTVKLYQIITKDKSFELNESGTETLKNFARSSAAREQNKILVALNRA